MSEHSCRAEARAGWTWPLLLLLLLLAFLPSRAGAEPEPFRVQLLWQHQAQFAGLYVAQAKGYYERAGLNVELIQGGPGIAPLERLGRGSVDVALAWLPTAIETRTRWDVANVAQVFRDSGMAIACRRDAGVNQIEDVKGKTIGVWYVGDELNLRIWLESIGLSAADVRITAQFPDGRDLISGRVDCAMTMMYNEYWSLLNSVLTPADLVVIRLADEGVGFLEDGFYATRDALADPERRAAIAAFVGATMRGWAYAMDHVDEALAISMAQSPRSNPEHQAWMLNSILSLIGPKDDAGLLDLESLERSVDMLEPHLVDRDVPRLAQTAWTHRIWYEAGLGTDSLIGLTRATGYHLATTTGANWFTGIIVVGSLVFGYAGFMRAQRRNYDLWGAFVLVLLPVVGGGVIRDILVGGDRYPPFVVREPMYLYLVLGAFLVGVVSSMFMNERVVGSRPFDWTMKFFDTLGLAALTIVGAQVALLAELSWIWIPICAALTCAGGGMLSDIVTGREPATFRGEPYEELAIIGGMVMLLGLQIADAYEHITWIAPAVIIATMVLVFSMRMLVILFGIRVHTFGRRRPVVLTPQPLGVSGFELEPVSESDELESTVQRERVLS